MSAESNYWQECIALAAEECGLTLDANQLEALAESARMGHEYYGMAFYSPSSECRVKSIESDWKSKYEALERELESYRRNAEEAIKKALRQYPDAIVTIGEHGEVLRHGGRTEVIQ